MKKLVHEWLRTGEVARILEVSADRVRQLERSGGLPATKIGGGLRLFCDVDVRRLLCERKRKARRGAK